MNPYNDSLFMKNAVLKIAAVVAVVLAVLISLNFFQVDNTFAQVEKLFLHVRMLEYDVVIPGQGTYHDIVAEGRIRRSMRNLSWDMIIDVNNSSVLHLDTVHKTAGFGGDENEAATMYFDMSRDFLRLVWTAVGEVLNNAPSAVEKSGQETMDGHIFFGYKLMTSFAFNC